MNPEQMKQMTGMFANMSDDQIRQYSQMAGMGNIDPSMLRNSASMMKNMKNDDLQNMTNMASKAYQNKQGPVQQPQQAAVQEDSYPTINQLKTSGNEAFKQGNFDLASSKYLEAILEIEELWTTNKSINQDPIKRKELQTLETSCRLNYCNVKAKQGDYDIVRIQALQVLQKEENGKAYFRLGQAYRHSNNLDMAIESLEKAKDLLPQDLTVSQLYDEVKDLLKQRQKVTKLDKTQKSENQDQKQCKVESQNQKDNNKLDYSQKEPVEKKPVEKEELKVDSKVEEQSKNTKQQDKVKKPIKLQSVDTDSKEFKQLKKETEEEKKKNDNVIITEEPQIIYQQQQQPVQTQPTPQQIPNFSNANMSQSYEQFKNMDPAQMGQMSNMMKNMDKGFMKNMMKQQMGYEISDSQIEMMQNMMTPEMIKSMQNIDPNTLKQMQQKTQQDQQKQQQQQQVKNEQGGEVQDQPNNNNDTNNQNNNNDNVQQSSQAPAMPSMSGLLQDPAMIQMLFNQLKSNPEMLKGLSGMMGNNPLSGYIERSSPQDLSRMIGYMQKLLTTVLFFVKIYTTLKKYWLVIIAILIAYIMFR